MQSCVSWPLGYNNPRVSSSRRILLSVGFSWVQLSPVKPYLLQILHHDDPLLLGLGHQDAAAAANGPAEEAPAPGSLSLVVAIGIVYPGVDLHQGCPLFLTDQPH